MINEEKELILDKNNKDITAHVIERTSSKIVVNYGKKNYLYKPSSLKTLKNPIILKNVIIKTPKTTLSNISKVLKFDNYIKVFFGNDKNKLYNESDLIIKKDIIGDDNISKVFNYFKEMASVLKMTDIIKESTPGKDNTDFLKNIYKRIDFINEESIVKDYIKGLSKINVHITDNLNIYPFSFNLSQQKAVKNAFANKISVIEGPPGTGKTQTILNIIANAIINNKTIAVLSNNNSATDNVFEKLEKQNLGSLCAKLGKGKNIEKFLQDQIDIKTYPKNWSLSENEVADIMLNLRAMIQDIEDYLKEKNEIAKLKQELEGLIIEQKYFNDKVVLNFMTD